MAAFRIIITDDRPGYAKRQMVSAVNAYSEKHALAKARREVMPTPWRTIEAEPITPKT